MQKTEEELHYDSMNSFVELANKLAAEGMPRRVVAAGLMTASCVYSTYLEVGNDGILDEAGVDRVADGYKKHLLFTQNSRKEKARQSSEEKVSETVDKNLNSPQDD